MERMRKKSTVTPTLGGKRLTLKPFDNAFSRYHVECY